MQPVFLETIFTVVQKIKEEITGVFLKLSPASNSPSYRCQDQDLA
jgi:hypothetical protein